MKRWCCKVKLRDKGIIKETKRWVFTQGRHTIPLHHTCSENATLCTIFKVCLILNRISLCQNRAWTMSIILYSNLIPSFSYHHNNPPHTTCHLEQLQHVAPGKHIPPPLTVFWSVLYLRNRFCSLNSRWLFWGSAAHAQHVLF